MKKKTRKLLLLIARWCLKLAAKSGKERFAAELQRMNERETDVRDRP